MTKFTKNGVRDVVVARALEEENSKAADRRIRSTLAHEAGHCLFHAHLFAVAEAQPLFADLSDPSVPKILCREEDEPSRSSYSGKWWEYQANRAIGSLLLPLSLVELALEPYMKPAGRLGLRAFDDSRLPEAAKALAAVFNVNPAVARIRIGQISQKEGVKGQLVL